MERYRAYIFMYAHLPVCYNCKNSVNSSANKNGEAFWAWLESIEVNGTKATDVDIRGVVRTTTSMWPGSYQQD